MQHNIQLYSTQIEIDIQQDNDTRHSFQTCHFEEGQVILHITYHSSEILDRIRVWYSTNLVPRPESEREPLIHANKIGIYLLWKILTLNKPYIFTLVFAALSKACTSFHLWEHISELTENKVRLQVWTSTNNDSFWKWVMS